MRQLGLITNCSRLRTEMSSFTISEVIRPKFQLPFRYFNATHFRALYGLFDGGYIVLERKTYKCLTLYSTVMRLLQITRLT